MEMNYLSENKLRISLSKSDISSLGIKGGVSGMEGEGFKNSDEFKSLLESARIKIGFDTADCAVSGSIYKTVVGGCDMYITRSAGIKQRGKNGEKNENAVFGFEHEQDMSKACYAMYSAGCRAECSAYYEKTSRGYKYYLIIKKKHGLYPLCIASEFCDGGENLPCDTYIPYIFEHCSVICEKNALSTLAKTVGDVVQ